MNRVELKRLAGKIVRLRPAVRRIGDDGSELPTIDDGWRLWDSFVPDVVVEAVNVSTGHVLPLTTDNVYESRNPDVVILKEQLTVHRFGMDLDPLPDPRARFTPPNLRSRS